jgi:hypothetical protein
VLAAAQFFFAETEHGAKRGIYEERLPVQVLDRDPYRTGVEGIKKKMNVQESGSRSGDSAVCLGLPLVAAEFVGPSEPCRYRSDSSGT